MSKRFTPPKESKKITIDIASLEAEKRALYISCKNPKRLEEVKKILGYFNWGI